MIFLRYITSNQRKKLVVVSKMCILFRYKRFKRFLPAIDDGHEINHMEKIRLITAKIQVKSHA